MRLHCILEFAFVEALDFADSVHGAIGIAEYDSWKVFIRQSRLPRNKNGAGHDRCVGRCHKLKEGKELRKVAEFL